MLSMSEYNVHKNYTMYVHVLLLTNFGTVGYKTGIVLDAVIIIDVSPAISSSDG